MSFKSLKSARVLARHIGSAALAAAICAAAAPLSAHAETPDYFVEWVQPSAALYVDTGIIGKCGVKAEVKFANVSCGNYPVMLGSWGGNRKRFNLVMHWGEQARWEYGDAMINMGAFPWYGTLVTAEVEVSAAGAMTGIWTDQCGGSIHPSTDATADYGVLDTGATFYLFASHYKDGSTDQAYQPHLGRLYHAKLWTGDTGSWTPVRDFIPCVKDGVAGLYDTVSATIFYPQGGNVLVAGPAKNDSGYAIGSVLHPATQYGRIHYDQRGGMGNGLWWHLKLSDYTFMGAGDIANLNGTGGSWQDNNLRWSQLRFDGWFYVDSAKAGTWTINQKFDDYFAFFIDNSLVLYNNSYQGEANSTVSVAEGWHRFTIIAGDTYGGYGSSKDYGSGFGKIPFTVTVGGAAYAFNNTNFPQGSGSNVVTLDADADWSANGPILLTGGAVLDLNGHNLVVKDIACDDYVGSYITNSAAAKKSVIFFTGTPTETKAYKDDLIKALDVRIILAHDGDQIATWTGAVSGDPANANNWQDLAGEPVVPTAAYAVKITGNNVNLQAPSGTDVACKSFEVGNCTFTADCDWRGLSHTPTITGTANLNGHVLAPRHLAAATGSVLSGGEGSTVTFDAADTSYGTFSEASFIDNFSSLTKSGSVKILFPKTGSGTLTASTALNIGTTSGGSTEFYQTDGSVSVGAFRVSTVAGGSAIYTMTNGTLTASSDFEIGGRGVGDFIQTGGTATLSSWLNLGRYGGKGTLTVNGGRMVNTYTDKVYVGAEGGTGIINVGGSGYLEVLQLALGAWNANNNKGYVNISGNGHLKTRQWVALCNNNNNRSGMYGEVNQSGGTFEIGTDMAIGERYTGTGVYNLTGGDMTVGLLQIGWNSGSVGRMTMGGGTATTRGDFYVGRDGTGTFNLSGGDMTVGGLVRIPWGSGGIGYMTMDGGTFTVNGNQLLVADWGKGTLVQNAGTVTVSKASAYVGIGQSSGSAGLYALNGGMLVTPQIKKGSGTGMFLLNGGTIVATNVTDGANFISGLDSLVFGNPGVTIDTAGANVSVTGCGMTADPGSALTKTGAGTLTLSSIPPADFVTVEQGTLALAAGGDNTSSTASLAHRWSFSSNLTDSVTGSTATWAKGDVTYNEGSTAARLTGTAKDTSYIELGPNKIPSDSATLEFWTTIRTRKVWTKLFCLGRDTSSIIGFTLNRDSDSGVSGLDVTGTSLLTGTGTLAADTPYYIAFTFAYNVDGSTTVKGLCLNATTKETVGSFERNVANWKLFDRIDQRYFSLGHSFWNDWDAIVDVDEVRVWAGALSDDALALSAQKGADATASDIADIVAANTVSVTRTLELASGTTLNIGAGNTLTQPVVTGSGTVAGGTLVVSDKVLVKCGETLTASGTIDLTNAKVELVDPENLTAGFYFIKVAPGATLSIVGKPEAVNLPNGWQISVTSGGAKIQKVGFTIFLR